MKDAIQEQLIAARRTQILDAAARVFAEQGFHPTTIKAIARAAGIADGTIYNYFENKTALMLGILDRMNESDQRAVDLSQLTNGDFRSLMRAYIHHRLTVLKADNFAVFRVVVSEVMVNRELRELYYQKILAPTFSTAEAYFQQWAAQHIIKPVNISLAVRAVSGMMLGLIVQHIMGDTILDAQWDALPEFLTDLILDGLGSEPA
ncbi:MAG: TetR/AcrR family transcriptional regulator [Chloroflexota bacterium]|nr:TetR/AcrR family transcriptional regulator [Chloroflexota bacterium]